MANECVFIPKVVLVEWQGVGLAWAVGQGEGNRARPLAWGSRDENSFPSKGGGTVVEGPGPVRAGSSLCSAGCAWRGVGLETACVSV